MSLTFLNVKVRRVKSPNDKRRRNHVERVSWILEMSEIDNPSSSPWWQSCLNRGTGNQQQAQGQKPG